MAAKEYRITLPGIKKPVVIMANSAEQAARRAEKSAGLGHVVTQRGYVSNVVQRHRETADA